MSVIHAIAVPKWGVEMKEGTINNWLKAEGESVSKGEEILEIESDKIANVWEAPADGILRRQLVEEGEARSVGQLLGIIAAADVEDAQIDAFIASFSEAEGVDAADAKPEPATPVVAAPVAVTPAKDGAGATRSSPVVRRLALEMGVDLGTVTGSGRNGRITQEDVQAAATGGTSSPATEEATAEFEIQAFSATRRTIARRLGDAKREIPHYYLSVSWEIDRLLDYRRTLNADASQKISLNDLIVYCVARALQREPRVNINVVDNAVHQYRTSNVSIAIATEKGLFPATLRGAEKLSPGEIAAATATLAEKARNGKLAREEISGASFTVSNLGMYDIDQFTAIINPPMGAILALGSAKQMPVVRDGELTVATVMKVTLSCDHRAIDGAVAASFLVALKSELESIGG